MHLYLVWHKCCYEAQNFMFYTATIKCICISISDIFCRITQWKAALKLDADENKNHHRISSNRNYVTESTLCGDAFPDQHLEGNLYRNNNFQVWSMRFKHIRHKLLACIVLQHRSITVYMFSDTGGGTDYLDDVLFIA